MPPRSDIHVRLPEDLHAALVAEADALGISLNAYIVIVLRDRREQKGT